MSILKKLYEFLTRAERRQALILLFMIMIMAFLDVAGVASIMPFMAVLLNPELIESNYYLAKLNSVLGYTDQRDFLFFLGLVVFSLLVVSISFKALTIYTQLRFILMREATIGSRLIGGYLSQPYTWFLNRNSSDLGKNVLSEVAEVVNSSMLSVVILFAHGVVSLSLIMLLIIVDFQIAVIVSSVLVFSYVGLFVVGKNTSSRAGKMRLSANNERFKVANEAFSAVKEIKVGGLEEGFVSRFSKYAEVYAKSYATAQVVSQLPRFGLEAIGFGGLLLMLLLMMQGGKSIDSILPLVSLYALAGYRLIPALQQVYSGFSLLRFSDSALENLYKDLSVLKQNNKNDSSFIQQIKFDESLELNNIFFTYPNTAKASLKNLNLTVQAGSKIGLVGSTGCGKTTTVDLILCLLTPQKGNIFIDGINLEQSNYREWQSLIGYVPQNIYLSDATVAENIAFGVDKNAIDSEKVIQASKIANLEEFVMKDLPNGYDSIIGERGVKLSGGQCQRIGIARALYLEPKVLILDEATSALDSVTEKSVMNSINNLQNDVTIIMIAHRLSTVRQCDQIYLLDNGKVKSSGTYDELKSIDKQFSNMANI